MTSPLPYSRFGRDRRWYPVVTVMPYLVVTILAAFTVIQRHAQPRSLLIDLGLCVVDALWMLGMFTLHPAWRERPRVMGVFITGLIVIMAILVLREPWFGFLVIAGYVFTFAVLPWPWRLAAIAAIAMVAGTAQMSGLPKDTPFAVTTYLVVLAVNILTMCAAAWAYWNGDEQNNRRKLALDEMNETNRRLETTLAENAALHARLLTQARQAGVRDERQRMAREIHDTLAQGLTGIITQLQAAEQARDEPSRWQRHFQAATSLARESLSEARRSVHALRPARLDEGQLSEALADVARRWSQLHGIAVEVTTTGTVRPMSAEAEFALLRLAQEALTNVAKHARANRVGLTLSYLEHEVALDVRDDGQGFEPTGLDNDGLDNGDTDRAASTSPNAAKAKDADAGSGGGFGLVAMRQRIENLSGTLQIESEPGFGTAISACIPAASAGANT